MNPAPVLDPAGAITAPKPTQFIDVGEMIGSVQFKYVNSADKRSAPGMPYNPAALPLLALDVRNLVGLIRLAAHLSERWGVTEVHHCGISGARDSAGDCYRQGRAVDFVGAGGATDNASFHVNILNDWALRSVPNLQNPQKPRLPDWPAGTGPLEYRLPSDRSADGFATAFFLDLYMFVAREYQDRTSGPGQTSLASTIGTPSFIMHPDHPTSAPGTKHGREAHRGHVHFQIGPTGTQVP